MVAKVKSKPKNNSKVILFIVGGFVVLFAMLGGGAYMIYRFAAGKVAEQKVSQQILDSENQVNSLLESGKYTDAMTVAKQMLTSSKNNNEKAISDQMIGYVYLAQKDCPNAQTSFAQSAGLDTNLPLDFLGEGNCDLLSKNYQKTIDDTQKGLTLLDSIQKLPDSVKTLDGLTSTSISQLQAVAHALMGTAYLGLGNKTQSVQELEEAVKLDPGNPQYTKDLNEVQNALKPSVTSKPTTQATTIKLTPAPAPIVGLGYTQADIDFLTNENISLEVSNWGSGITAGLPSPGSSKYSQQVLQQAQQLSNEEFPLVQELLTKIQAKQPFTQQDINDYNEVKSIKAQLDALSKQTN